MPLWLHDWLHKTVILSTGSDGSRVELRVEVPKWGRAKRAEGSKDHPCNGTSGRVENEGLLGAESHLSCARQRRSGRQSDGNDLRRVLTGRERRHPCRRTRWVTRGNAQRILRARQVCRENSDLDRTSTGWEAVGPQTETVHKCRVEGNRAVGQTHLDHETSATRQCPGRVVRENGHAAYRGAHLCARAIQVKCHRQWSSCLRPNGGRCTTGGEQRSSECARGNQRRQRHSMAGHVADPPQRDRLQIPTWIMSGRQRNFPGIPDRRDCVTGFSSGQSRFWDRFRLGRSQESSKPSGRGLLVPRTTRDSEHRSLGFVEPGGRIPRP